MTFETKTGKYGQYTVQASALDSGGQATVFPVVGKRVEGVDLLFKRFDKPPRTSQERQELAQRLDLLVDVGRNVFCTQKLRLGETPASSFSWPIDVIPERSGGSHGVILPRAPKRFLIPKSGKGRTMEWLYLYRTLPPHALLRILILIRLASALNFLAQNKLVHGDVAPRNIMWTLDPEPQIFILDMDGVHKDGSAYDAYVATDQWNDPRIQKGELVGHDLRSDWYAMALFVYRCLLGTTTSIPFPKSSHDPWTPDIDSIIPAQVRQSLTRVLVGRLRADLRLRPDEWTHVLADAFFPNGIASTSAIASVDAAYARRRRTDRRSGELGPPFTALAQSLNQARALV